MKKYEDMNELERRIYQMATSTMYQTIDTTKNKDSWIAECEKKMKLISNALKGDINAFDEYLDIAKEHAIEENDIQSSYDAEIAEALG